MRPEVKEALDVVCAAVSTRVVQADEFLFLIKKVHVNLSLKWSQQQKNNIREDLIDS
jgi:predicted transcriptional regulator